ncbi:MAG: tetratricopeptide repeat protein [Crocosphaera sp.]|nr:tetratricopeptide repeat protein [Crocosphaera sp.]
MLGLVAPVQAQIATIDSINPQTGQVLLKREEWSDFRPVSAGSELNEGDQIYPSQGVQVKLVCPDRTQQPVIPGIPSGIKTICPTWEIRISKAPPPPGILGGFDSSIPYIISPRHTLLLTHQPLLRWNAVPQATSYTVQVMNGQNTIWKAEVQQPQVAYPEHPPLTPGITYSLKITTNSGQSSQQDSESNLGFIILRPAEAQIINDEVAKIKQGEFSPLTTALLLADLYRNYTLPVSSIEAYGLTSEQARSYHLTSEAITTLIPLTEQKEPSPIFYRILGELYWQSGLVDLTIEHYLQAIEIAKSPEFLEEKTLAQFGLGEVYTAINNIEQAIIFYEQARQGYIELGDTKRINFLERRLETLESR